MEINILFRPGRIVATPGALDLLERQGLDAKPFLTRHLTGDWGDLTRDDKRANDAAVKGGDRILSAYKTPQGKLWIITEWDRSATTLLLPDEYQEPDMIGMLWHDMTKDKPLALKLIEATQAYTSKYGNVPGWAVVNPRDIPEGHQGDLAGLKLTSARWVRPNHIFIGKEA